MSKYPGRIVSNLAPAGYSVYFNGANSDALEVPNNAAFDFGTGDVTIEAWFYLASTSTIQNLIECAPSGGSGFTSWNVDITASGFMRMNSYVAGNYQAFEASNNALLPNRWYHFAFTRSSGTNRLFVNGALCTAGGTFTQAINSGGNTVTIGRGKYAGFTRPSTGNFSNVRIVKGVALYTAAFNAPTQLFNVTGTSLLTCNSPAFVDQSSNAFPITTLATPSISTFTPFTAYVPYNPALGAATPGIWTVDEAMQAAATRQWNMYDPYFNLTTLLLHGNGTNGAQNNTFLDSSSNNFTITRNGNTTQGSYSPFSLQTGAWSNFFGGYAVSNSAVLATNTSTFTIEGWINPTVAAVSTSGIPSIIGDMQPTGTLAYWTFGILASGALSFYWFDGGAKSAVTTGTVSLNVWTHIAISVNANAITMYINGVQQSLTGTTTLTNRAGGTSTVAIGQFSSPNSIYTGYISNLSVLSGTAKYSMSFAPPTTPLPTGTTNQVLLFAYSNSLVDSNTATTPKTFTITNAATPVSVQPFSPFYPTVAYTPQTIGGSGYFDGTGDYLSVASNTAFQLGTGDWTVEYFVYPTTFSNSPTMVDTRASTGGNGYADYFNTSGKYLLFWSNANQYTSAATFVTNNWYHIAVCRASGTVSVYINGNRDGTFSSSTNLSDSNLRIGNNEGASGGITGYLSSVRIVKGTAVYSGTTITVPTAPLTSITNTSILTNFTNAGVVDSTSDNVVETVGNASISTAVSKFGGSSMFFDGSGDYLQVGPSQLLNLGSSDFTIEFWIYPTSFAAASYPMYSTTARAKADVLAFEISTGGVIVAYITAAGGGVWSIMSGGNIGTLTLNTWNHVALVRNGTVFRGYVNGVQGGMTNTSSSAVASFDGFSIGAFVASGFLTGYMDDIRVTRFARYTAAFTPQTSQWQDQ